MYLTLAKLENVVKTHSQAQLMMMTAEQQKQPDQSAEEQSAAVEAEVAVADTAAVFDSTSQPTHSKKQRFHLPVQSGSSQRGRCVTRTTCSAQTAFSRRKKKEADQLAEEKAQNEQRKKAEEKENLRLLFLN